MSFTARLSALLAPAGITIVHPFNLQTYNRAVCGLAHPEWALAEFGRASTLGVLLGTSAAVWAPLTEFLRVNGWLAGRDYGRLAHPNPFDEYTDQHIARALAELGLPYERRRNNEMGPRFAHLLLAAHVSGFAYRNTNASMCVHPTLGPWFSLSTLLSVDEDGPPPGPPAANPCPELDAAVTERMAALMGTHQVSPPTQGWTGR